MKAMTDLILEEGWPYVVGSVVAAFVLALLDLELLSLLALVLAGLSVWTYRRPVRTVAHFEKGSVTAPCDGSVTSVETHQDGSIVVEIETGCLDTSVLTAPFEGTMVKKKLVRGARLGRFSTLRPLLNEYAVVVFEDAGGGRVRVTHTLLRGAAPLVIDGVNASKRLSRGTRYGVAVRGLTTIHLPASARVAVNPGESVNATETLLGYMR